jgi:acid stress-induced BolA-like protein IbaG/YrbA
MEEEEVRRALLAAGFTAEQIQLEVTESGNVGGFVISPRFVGQPQVDRQEALWADLRPHLAPERLHRIVSILTMTPEEIDDDVRVAHGCGA